MRRRSSASPGKCTTFQSGFGSAPVRGDDQNVRARCEEDLVRREVLVERGQHLRRQLVIELVEMQPLAEDATVGEMGSHSTIKLRREQPGNAAHPRVRRLGEDEIESPAAGGEVGLRVVEDEVCTAVVEDASVRGIEGARRRDHLRLDLDRRQVPDVGTAEEQVRGHPRALTDDRHLPRIRAMRERDHG